MRREKIKEVFQKQSYLNDLNKLTRVMIVAENKKLNCPSKAKLITP